MPTSGACSRPSSRRSSQRSSAGSASWVRNATCAPDASRISRLRVPPWLKRDGAISSTRAPCARDAATEPSVEPESHTSSSCSTVWFASAASVRASSSPPSRTGIATVTAALTASPSRRRASRPHQLHPVRARAAQRPPVRRRHRAQLLGRLALQRHRADRARVAARPFAGTQVVAAGERVDAHAVATARQRQRRRLQPLTWACSIRPPSRPCARPPARTPCAGSRPAPTPHSARRSRSRACPRTAPGTPSSPRPAAPRPPPSRPSGAGRTALRRTSFPAPRPPQAPCRRRPLRRSARAPEQVTVPAGE